MINISQEIARIEAIAQLETAQAAIIEYLVSAFENKTRYELRARIFFSATIKEIKNNVLTVNIEDDADLIEKIIILPMLDTKSDDFKGILKNLLKQKQLTFTINELLFSIPKAVTAATPEARRKVMERLKEFVVSVEKLPNQLKWLERCKLKLKLAFLEALEQDRAKLDWSVLNTLDETIMFQKNTNKLFADFNREQLNQLKLKYGDRFKETETEDMEDEK